MLKNKEMAKILYDLYSNFRDTEVTLDQRKKYQFCNITTEEIWAIENSSVFCSDITTIDLERELVVTRRSFLLNLFMPFYPQKRDNEIVYNYDFDKFIIKNGLGHGIFDTVSDLEKWVKFDYEDMLEEDAEVLVSNLKEFLQANNVTY